jgi:hypothetical protein
VRELEEGKEIVTCCNGQKSEQHIIQRNTQQMADSHFVESGSHFDELRSHLEGPGSWCEGLDSHSKIPLSII